MIFLDSDTLSYFLAENSKIVHRVKKTIEDGNVLAISSVSAYEILKGLQYRGNKRKAAHFQDLLGYIEVFPFSLDFVPIAAGIYAELRQSGKTIGDADILIASTVIAGNGVLVTNNEKHYKNIKSLTLENWLT
ncbi:PIN domain nuclease [Spirochaetia bacterium]|nr:PIN domain nuclease [Spirochaetia bacterium]